MLTLAQASMATRLFGLVVTLSLTVAFASHRGSALLWGAALAGLVTVIVLIANRTRKPNIWPTAVEACLVAVVIAVSFPGTLTLVPYLAVPALVGGLCRGAWGTGLVIADELIAFTATSIPLQSPLNALQGQVVLTWVLTGVGLGLLGSFARAVHLRSTEADTNYRDARDLLTQLRALSGRLTAGLDPTDIADHLITACLAELGDAHAVVFVPGEAGVIFPLRYSRNAPVEEFYGCEDLVRSAWSSGRPTRQEAHYAVPLMTAGRPVAGLVIRGTDQAPTSVLSAASEAAVVDTLRLETALLFDEIRLAATHEERHRLAREVHDGVAQDVASLGYLLDDAVASCGDAGVEAKLREVREALQGVVSELRYSVFDLRYDVSATEGLGSSIARYARQLGSRAGLTIHLTLDESGTRLRPDVESELLRMAQEAMANARKHARAHQLWVSCSVHPPHAEISVRDDGLGLQSANPESSGLRIMRERAERVAANLEISPGAGGGTVVRIRLLPPRSADASGPPVDLTPREAASS